MLKSERSSVNKKSRRLKLRDVARRKRNGKRRNRGQLLKLNSRKSSAYRRSELMRSAPRWKSSRQSVKPPKKKLSRKKKSESNCRKRRLRRLCVRIESGRRRKHVWMRCFIKTKAKLRMRRRRLTHLP